MKFSYKILLWTMIIMAAAFGVSGYFFVNYVFRTSMEREISQAMDESSILQFAFETAALNIPSRYDVLADSTVEQIGSNLENGGRGSGRLLRISDENRKPLYTSDGFVEEDRLLTQIIAKARSYQVIQKGEHYYVQTGAQIDALDRILYLETMKDVTAVYEERAEGFAMYRRVTLLVLLCSGIVMFFISYWLTRPIRLLTFAARKMTEGDYAYRAEKVSSDEMGQLTVDFNRMANALEDNIQKLQNEVRAKEDFIAAFSHELKTPLTAIIGYADMLRSRKLDEEKHFLSANYIYTEGKRLETMSFRLMDIIVAKRDRIELAEKPVGELFVYLQELYGGKQDRDFWFDWEEASIWCEADLLKTVLLNLVDNAVKASETGQRIEITGKKEQDGYRFQVKDHGIGIPKEEQQKITEAFYMVDKSRSRSRNGAGLGLALCASILELHNSKLSVESVVGEGSCISFLIPEKEVNGLA